EQLAVQFALDDGTIVRDAARIDFGLERCLSSGHFHEPDERLQLFLYLHGKRHIDFVGLNRSLRYWEGIIEPGDRLCVRGIADWEHAPDGPGASYRDPPRRLILHNCSVFVRN